jgi:hypothetical protein
MTSPEDRRSPGVEPLGGRPLFAGRTSAIGDEATRTRPADEEDEPRPRRDGQTSPPGSPTSSNLRGTLNRGVGPDQPSPNSNVTVNFEKHPRFQSVPKLPELNQDFLDWYFAIEAKIMGAGIGHEDIEHFLDTLTGMDLEMLGRKEELHSEGLKNLAWSSRFTLRQLAR